jgi:prepilin-type N-terminal cleavage/methylation domain-containing protein
MRRLSSPYQSGFTLIELILVLGVMVMIFSLAIPLVTRTMGGHALRQSAERVRVAMGQARVRAIREGEVYAVFFVEGGQWFNVAPFSKSQEQAAIANNRQQLADQGVQSNFESDLLPSGISFAANVIPINARAAETLGGEGESGQIRPILFYADGSSQNAKIVMQNSKQSYVEIQLRGLTGLSSVVRLNEAPRAQ